MHKKEAEKLLDFLALEYSIGWSVSFILATRRSLNMLVLRGLSEKIK